VKCNFADSWLQGYFDGELRGRRAAEFERHLQHCVDCVAQLVDLDLLRGRLQLTQLYEPAPASLRRTINAHLHPIAPTTASSQPLLWHWLAAAAVLLLVAVVVSRVNPDLRSHDYQAELAGEIVEMHRHSLQPGHTTGIASNNEEVVRQWFDDRLRFGLPVRNFADEGFALQGARLDNFEGGSVAALVYVGGGHLINVFMWPTKEADRSPHAGSLGDYQWIYWRKHRVEFCLVSDAAPGDLDRLHRLIAE
jgi:anti-sigma factor RsiW